MKSRLPFRSLQSLYILRRLPRLLVRHKKPASPRRILVIHQLLLGDTLMTTSLLAKLRKRYPDSEIYLATHKSFVPLYAGRPYGVKTVPFDMFSPSSFSALLKLPRFDLALIPGDNRYGWTAFALGARWIAGFAGDRPGYKSWCFNELIPWPETPQAWTDIAANLIEGPPPDNFKDGDWPPPECAHFAMPEKPFAILHVGTRSPLKTWPVDKWQALISAIKGKGLTVALTCGPDETRVIRMLKTEMEDYLYPGNLSLAQMWKLLEKADLLICPDNGISHLARIAGTPTVCLYGPGSSFLFGTGQFWSKRPCKPVSKSMPCRNQHNLFKRCISWIETCERSADDCSHTLCMEAIEVQDVLDAAAEVLPCP
jgi:ADP-heptose:LPS heptosyltransferase